jgi:hypothetical protein
MDMENWQHGRSRSRLAGPGRSRFEPAFIEVPALLG